MGNRRFLMVRLTKDQDEKIKNDAKLKGFEHISDYVRSSLIDRNLERKIEEMHKKIVHEEIDTKQKFRVNSLLVK